MAAIGHMPTIPTLPLDFSVRFPAEALDLSARNTQQREFYAVECRRDSQSGSFTPPQVYPRHMRDIHSSPDHIQRMHMSPNHSSPNQSPSPHHMAFTSNESLNELHLRNNRSPSLYSNGDSKEIKVSPNVTPIQFSNYTAPEHLSQFSINNMLQQHLIMQSHNRQQTKSESSYDGSEKSYEAPNNPVYLVGNNAPKDRKMSRPFKAYPLTLASGCAAVDDEKSLEYADFRNKMLEQIRAANGGSVTVSNPKMRRTISSVGRGDEGNENKDDSYTEKRMKNNAAAKKSRDRRKIKEDELAIRAAFLECENIRLREELAALRMHHVDCSKRSPTS